MVLDWEGAVNIREIFPGVVRSATIDGLTAQGRQQLLDHGIRRIIDLRNHDEVGKALRLEGVETLHFDLDGLHDREFWDIWWHGPQVGTPLYYPPFLERFPDRVATILRHIATASEGVLFHCGRGRDRTGLISLMLWKLMEADVELVVQDYLLSEPFSPDETAKLREYLAERGTSAEQLVRDLYPSLDVGKFLGEEELAALKARLSRPGRAAEASRSL